MEYGIWKLYSAEWKHFNNKQLNTKSSNCEFKNLKSVKWKFVDKSGNENLYKKKKKENLHHLRCIYYNTSTHNTTQHNRARSCTNGHSIWPPTRQWWTMRAWLPWRPRGSSACPFRLSGLPPPAGPREPTRIWHMAGILGAGWWSTVWWTVECCSASFHQWVSCGGQTSRLASQLAGDPEECSLYTDRTMKGCDIWDAATV